MELERHKEAAWIEVRISGRLDAANAQALDAELEEIIRSGEHHIRAHMAQVDYMSSAGIRILLKYYQMLRKLDGRFGIIAPSEQVASVVALTGLNDLYAGDTTGDAAATGTRQAAGTRNINGINLTDFMIDETARMKPALHGDPARLEKTGFPDTGSRRLAVSSDMIAVGIGAFGNGFEDCRDRFGEFMAAGGAAVCLPAGDARAPDYSIARGGFIPEAETLYAAAAQGPIQRCIRFDTAPGSPAALEQIIEAAMTLCNEEVIAMAMVAESAGLTGAWLRQSPAQEAAQDFFAYPGVRDRLTWAPEHIHDRCLALTAGLAAAAARDALAPFLRPLAPESRTSGHFHAAAFTWRALPYGALDLAEVTETLFEEQALLGLMHLINDTRTLTGAGESLFVRGAIWLSPLAPA
jgi:anti-anti-sigma factor